MKDEKVLSPEKITMEDQFQFIDEIADDYSRDRWEQTAQVEKELEPVINVLKKNDVCLELGAGAGTVMQVINNAGYKVIGIDKSERMVKNAVDHEIQNMVRGNGFNLPFQNETFDAVFSWGNTLGPIPGEENRLQMLKEARRVLKPGGILALSVLNKGCNLRRSMGPREYAFHYHAKSKNWKSELAGYNKFYSIGELKKQLTRAGFQRFRRLTSRCDLAIVLLADGNTKL